MQHSAVTYGTYSVMQCNSVKYGTVQYNEVQCNEVHTVQPSAVQCYGLLAAGIPHCHDIMQLYSAQPSCPCSALYFTVLYYTVAISTALFATVH